MDPFGRAMQAVAPLLVAASLMAIVLAAATHGEGDYIGLYVFGVAGAVCGVGLMWTER